LDAETVPDLRELTSKIKKQVATYKTLAMIPAQITNNVWNDMYLASKTLRVMEKAKNLQFNAEDKDALINYRHQLDRAIKSIPDWVKVAVAMALRLGTMVGWKRIVVTVGERIGKQHLTYAQGASSELIAMGTILATDRFGVPVSTTHVLTSGVAGTMMANNAGLQGGTLRSLTLAWLLTLPASVMLSGGLSWLFRHLG
jgi:inorganic phosphate transporter, PiT family